jgi:hypothetical protein
MAYVMFICYENKKDVPVLEKLSVRRNKKVNCIINRGKLICRPGLWLARL